MNILIIAAIYYSLKPKQKNQLQNRFFLTPKSKGLAAMTKQKVIIEDVVKTSAKTETSI